MPRVHQQMLFWFGETTHTHTDTPNNCQHVGSSKVMIHIKNHLSNGRKPGCSGYLGDYTTQLCGD